MTHVVEISGVTKRYGQVEAVRDVSFGLRPGATALVGHNGAGKTTLMKLMLGLIRPTQGKVAVLGDNPAAGQFSARKNLGYLPEAITFNPELTGQETLTFYARLKREPVKESLRLLDRVGLGEAGPRRVGTYSKGMRQRLGLAQALIGRPRLLLLDEPTTGLDPELRQSFYELVLELAASGTAVLLASHALSELEERADRVLIMDRGILVADGSVEDLRRIAQLPSRIRVKGPQPRSLPDGIPEPRDIGRKGFEIEVPDLRKVEVARALLCGDNPPEDIELVPPSLDELYAHFLRTRGAA